MALCNSIQDAEDLHYACYTSRDYNRLTTKLYGGVNPDHQWYYTGGHNGRTPLHAASYNSDTLSVRALIQWGANTEAIWRYNGHTPLHTASSRGSIGAAKALLAQHCNTDAKNNNGDTPLDVAVRERHTEIVDLLKSHIHYQPKDPLSSYISVVRLSEMPVDDVWLNLGLELGLSREELSDIEMKTNPQDCKTAMFLNVKKSNVDDFNLKMLVKSLLRVGKSDLADEICNNEGYSCTTVAAHYGWLDLLKFLSQMKGYNLKAPVTKDGSTLLAIACGNGQLNVTKYLVEEVHCDPKDPSIPSAPVTKDGSTLLAIACGNGQLNVTRYLVEEVHCDPKGIVNKSGQTLFTLAYANRHKKIVQYLVEVHYCDPRFEVNEDGDTPFHLECTNGDLEMIKCLDDKKGHLDGVLNKSGQTLLSLAYANRHKMIVQYLVEVHHCNPRFEVNEAGDTPFHLECASGDLEMIKCLDDKKGNLDGVVNKSGQSLLSLAYANRHKKIVQYLVEVHHCEPRFEVNEAGDTPFHLECISGDLEMIKCLDDKKGNLDGVVNKSGQTLISLAYANRHKKIVQYLVEVHHCDPRFEVSEAGDTPFHLECISGDLKMIKCLDDKKGNLDDCLLISCKHNHKRIVDYLLNDRHCNPNVKNDDGQTPLALTTDNKIIRSLLKHGARAADVYKTYRKAVGKLSSNRLPENPLPILITGKGGAGKSTFLTALLAVLSLFQHVVSLFKVQHVSNVDKKTVGIIPYLYETKKFGLVAIYDFAGQEEFYTSHSAVVKNAVHTCTPIIIFCCNLLDSETDIIKTIAYWMNLIQNQCSALQDQAHVVVVGSHADILLGKGVDLKSKEGIFGSVIENFPKFKLLAFVPMDCRLPDSAGMKEVRQHIEKSSALLRSPEAISLNAHTFHTYIQDNFTNEVAVPLKLVRSKVADDLKQAQSESMMDLLSFIPNTLPRVIEICSELSQKGHILFLPNKSTPEQSYVVCDQQALLSHVTGTVYAPEGFRQHCKLASSTGVVPLAKFADQFKKYDLQMILAFMSYLELCFEVKDEEALEHIAKRSHEGASATPFGNRHLLFPGLIRIAIPGDIWEPRPLYKFYFGWLLKCTGTFQFFESRFLQILQLRLSLSLGLAPEVDEDVPSLQCSCFMWKSGICWCDDNGICCLIELVEQAKALVVQMRSEEITPEGLNLRCRVVKKVLEAAREFCSDVDTVEAIIEPSHVKTHPLKPVSNLSMFKIEQVATAIIDRKSSVRSFTRPDATSLKEIVVFEPYSALGTEALKFLFHPQNPVLKEKVSKSFMAHLVTNVQDSESETLFCGMFSPRPVQRLSHTLETWRSETESTYQCLRDKLDKYSIFGGRNPLDLAGVPPGDWDPSLFIDTEEPEPIPEHPHQLQPDLVTDIDLDSVDDSTRLGDDDVADILTELSGMEPEFESLALWLHLPLATVGIIKRDYHYSCRTAFVQVITEWVLMNYNHARFGAPSWRLLVAAVDTLDHDRAKQIASRHRKDLAGIPPGDWDSSLLAAIEEPVPEHTQLDLDIESVDDTTRLDADDDTAEILKELTNLDSDRKSQ